MLDYQRRARERVEQWLDSTDGNDDVWSLFGVCCGGYNGDIDERVAWVLEQMAAHTFFARDEYDELVSYLWCSVDVGEYGTSPCSAWLMGGLEDLVPRMLAKIRAGAVA